MRYAGLVRLLILAAAGACVLIALGVLPDVRTGGELSRPPAVILNDTSATVLAGRCSGGCRDAEKLVDLPPGHTLRAGAASGSAVWLIEDAAGGRLGCLRSMSSGEAAPLRVSHLEPCPR